MIHTRSHRGFTLIELIIVVAIIGILASVILAALGESREQARNRAKNATVQQYVRALELVRTDQGTYPTTADAWNCLGTGYTGGTCIGSWDEDASLNSTLSTYIDLPGDDSTLSSNRRGFIYQPSGATYEIRWFLEGTARECVAGQAAISDNYSNEGITYCRYLHQ